MRKFPFYEQLDIMDCGPTCLRMIAKFYGRNINLQKIRDNSGFSREGVSFLGIAEAAEILGFRTLAIKLPLKSLVKDAPLPCIIHWQQNHFVVLVKTKKEYVILADPGKGIRKMSQEDFCEHWATTQEDGEPVGVALLVEPTPKFYETEDDKSNGLDFSYLFKYLWQYKKLLLQLVVGLLVGSGLQLVFPFLTQSIVDVGIQTRNLNFIYVILGYCSTSVFASISAFYRIF
jgi:ATP-binding cassette, subfamily B, bacterial